MYLSAKGGLLMLKGKPRLMTSGSSKMAGGVASTAIGYVAPPFAAIVTSPILARSLGVEGRGEIAAATAPYMLGIVVATMGIPEAVTYFVARNQREVHSIVVKAAFLSMAAASVAVVMILPF